MVWRVLPRHTLTYSRGHDARLPGLFGGECRRGDAPEVDTFSENQGIPNQLAKVKRHQLQETCSPRPTRRSLQPPEGVREQ